MTHATTPLFSIITATYNAQSNIIGLLHSLKEQSCRDFELIIQDGGSTDATLDIVATEAAHLPRVDTCSETDHGIYDAWNKATQRARGQWLIFLGADDRLADEHTLAKTAVILNQQVPAESLFGAGSVSMVDMDGRARLQAKPNFDGKSSERLPHIAPVAFPALFIRREIALACPFDTTLRISADYDFLCRTWDENKAVLLPFEIAVMLEGGISSAPQNQFFAAWENARVAARHFTGTWNFKRLTMLTKAGIVSGAFRLLGHSQAAKVLDTIRQMRGLPPCWKR